MATPPDFSRGFDQLKRNLEELGQQRRVGFDELFPPAFMEAHTKFPTMEAMLAASPIPITSPEDFHALPEAEWDAFVRAQTSFDSWAAMKNAAGAEWARGQLRKGFPT